MKNLVLIAIILVAFSMCNVGCVEGGGGSSAKSAPTNEIAPPADPSPGLTPGPNTVSVTYYRLSRTEAPVNGWPNKTYTATGYCAEIQGATFCWSDGLKTLQWVSNNFQYGPLTYNYFGLSTSNGNPQTCHGGCADDYMDSPVLVTNQLLNVLSAQDVQNVFDHGTPGSLNCEVNNGNLDCGSVIFAGVQ